MRFYLALFIGKLTNLLIKYFYPGSGGTWPGNIAIEIDKNFLAHSKIHFPKGVFIVSGTNGKTTTSKLISHFLESSGLKVTHNRSGGNILNGIASAVVKDLPLFGKLPNEVAVFEVDELHLIPLLEQVSPSTLVLLNLSRDQLDRYGEIDIVLDKWKDSLQKLPQTCNVIVDSNASYFKGLDKFVSGNTYFFDTDSKNLHKTKLFGEFNAKNINATVVAVEKSNLDIKVTDEILDSFEAAYGRGEMLNYKNTFFQVFLAKNPASFNYNLSTILENSTRINPDTILFILNDEIRDGHDVSWIYDIKSELLATVCANKNIFVAGKRYLDMAIRIQYSQVALEDKNLNLSLKETINTISTKENIKSVLVLPNYSAMLAFRKIVTGKEIL